MARSSATCKHCHERLDKGTRGLFLDADEHQVHDWHDAKWKTCPTCSKLAKKHVFLRFPAAYGGTGTRTLASGEIVPQDACYFHRPYRNGKQVHAGERNPESERRECCGNGNVSVRSGPGRAPAARHPTVRRGRTSESVAPDDAPWTDDDIKGLVRALVAMPLDEEGQRRLVEHVHLERSSRRRADFLRERVRQGRVKCDACGEDLALKYGAAFAEVVEVHHRVALWKGTQTATGDMLALLCPTCHRVVHHRQREPRTVEEVANLVARRR